MFGAAEEGEFTSSFRGKRAEALRRDCSSGSSGRFLKELAGEGFVEGFRTV